jgi:hypothetical protein
MSDTALAILAGAAGAAFLDGLAATIDFRMRGVSFARLWQGVASGALGPSSFQRGNTTVFLGLAFHILIATTASLVFNIAAGHAHTLLTHYIASGALYGIAVYFVMNFVVIPLSAMRPRPFALAITIRQLLIHIACVGLPISIAAQWFSPK